MLAAWVPVLVASWRRLHGLPVDGPWGEADLDRAAREVARFSAGPEGIRALVGRPYLEDDALMAAYLLHWWPTSYRQTASLLARMPGLVAPGTRVLDLGCGPGPVSAAVRDVGAWVEGADHTPNARRVYEAMLGARAWPRDLRAGPPPNAPAVDIVWAGHVLHELHPPSRDAVHRRVEVVSAWMAGCAPAGRFVLVEPATRSSNAEVLALRDALAQAGWTMEGPCLMNAPCPLRPTGSACHATVSSVEPPLLSAIARRAALPRGEVGFSWLVARPPGAPAAGARAGWRVVSEPMTNRAGRIRRVVCGPSGRSTLSTPAALQAPWRPMWDGLTRGDLVAVEGAEVREGGLGLIDASRLQLLAFEAR
jgi:SAM-dependent methyltransferase